jgi:hypothetical protein
MVDLVVKFNSKKVLQDVSRTISLETKEAVEDLFRTVRRRSPVGKTGAFKRNWSKSRTARRAYISNPQPYAQSLEDGRSKLQAPNGVVRPAIAEVIQRRNAIRRTK